MISWNITNARQVEPINTLNPNLDEQTLVRPPPARDKVHDDEKQVRAIALLFAIALTALVAVWQDPQSPLWWLLCALALSGWCCALGSFIADILKVSIEWLVEALTYLRSLMAAWGDGARRFVDRWIWSRFRVNQSEVKR